MILFSINIRVFGGDPIFISLNCLMDLIGLNILLVQKTIVLA